MMVYSRGGLPLQIVRKEDVVRLGKFTLTPRGVLWNLNESITTKTKSYKRKQRF